MEAQHELIQPRFIRAKEWELRTGMNIWATYRALNAGQLRGVKIGESWLIERSELTEYFARCSKTAA